MFQSKPFRHISPRLQERLYSLYSSLMPLSSTQVFRISSLNQVRPSRTKSDQSDS